MFIDSGNYVTCTRLMFDFDFLFDWSLILDAQRSVDFGTGETDPESSTSSGLATTHHMIRSPFVHVEGMGDETTFTFTPASFIQIGPEDISSFQIRYIVPPHSFHVQYLHHTLCADTSWWWYAEIDEAFPWNFEHGFRMHCSCTMGSGTVRYRWRSMSCTWCWTRANWRWSTCLGTFPPHSQWVKHSIRTSGTEWLSLLTPPMGPSLRKWTRRRTWPLWTD